MKRILAALFLALVVALVVASGVASAVPPHNFTAGGGKVVTKRFSDTQTTVEKFAFIAFSAHAIGSTTEARNGHFVYHDTTTTPSGTFEFELKGSINCVLWSGNHAAFSGLIKKSTASPTASPILGDVEGQHAFFAVADNDSIGTPDQFGFFGTDPRRCPHLYDPFVSIPPITRGNILVSGAAQ
jgi:hypothetical protein